GQDLGVEVEVVHAVKRKAAAQLGEAAQVERGAGVPGLVVVLRELEDKTLGEIAVALEKGDEIAEERSIAERVAGDVAEEVQRLAAMLDLAHELDAADQQHVVNGCDHALALGEADVLLRQDHVTV